MKSNTQKLSVDFINHLPYPDFVGFINQWNVLPGAHVTLSKWATFSQMNSESKLLQIACTTGFQSRELALYTGCSAKGIDLSIYAIDAAKYNKQHYAPNCNLTYEVADGLLYKDAETYTHVSFGAGLRFFNDPEKALSVATSLLVDHGYILASPFYCIKEMPESVIDQCRKVFGITPTYEDYKKVMSLYKDLEIIYQDHNDLYLETNEELKHYCEVTIDRACKMHQIDDEQLRGAMYARLLNLRKATNIGSPIALADMHLVTPFWRRERNAFFRCTHAPCFL
jgi:ubiquinone/menaquinone biosynthesis C-methylase UbiE